ncbi:MAG: VTT domain-containing protein [Candidatus Nanoarchaeia archaeon]
MKIHTKKILEFSLILILFTIYIIIVSQLEASSIVSQIGINNSYIIIFLIATFGGVSALTSASFYALFVLFLYGGSNYILLSVLSAIGLTIGDAFFYYLGYIGSEITNKTKYSKYFKNIQKYINKYSKWKIFYIITFFQSLPLPLPTDFISASAGIVKYSPKLTLLALGIGNLVHLLIISILLVYFEIIIF